MSLAACSRSNLAGSAFSSWTRASERAIRRWIDSMSLFIASVTLSSSSSAQRAAAGKE
jgi:hypothetical protein